MIDFVEPSIIIFVWLQLFNWFSKQKIIIVFATIQIVQAIANILQMTLHNEYLAEKYLTAGLLMFVFALVDYKWFKFYPLEAGIFIDVNGRSRRDREIFN